MSKQIYIDSNGNEVLVSGTIINDNNLPHYTGTPTAGTTAYEIANATNYKVIYSQSTYQNDIGTSITTLSDLITDFRFLRVVVYISSISSSSRGIALVANCKQAFGANYIPICINGTLGSIRIETTAGKTFTLLALSSTLGNSCCVGEIIGIY